MTGFLRGSVLLAPLAVLGCTVSSLPPSASRTDGGPVAARGTVTHQARSELRLYRDAAGCESVQTVNRQFRLVRVRGPGESPVRRLVLEESYDIRHCLMAGSVSSEAIITAWAPDTASAEPVFRISGRGVTGAATGSLYRMVARGCCGGQDLITYYSLISGRALMTTSRTPIRLEGPEPGRVRLLGFHDTHSAAAPPEAEGDATVAGVLTWTDEERPIARFVVRTDRPDHFAAGELAVFRGGRRSTDTLQVLVPTEAADSALQVDIRLVSPASGRTVTVRIPLGADGIDLIGAQVSGGARLDRLGDR
ncbi:MAG: hypothetical protein FJ206_12605 [Gemmatimonadetes bacterium]|nr:hypothetical protein [Gemmatimonadota bacterium]